MKSVIKKYAKEKLVYFSINIKQNGKKKWISKAYIYFNNLNFLYDGQFLYRIQL